MSYKDFVAEDRRLVILKLLEEDPGGSHNHAVLQEALRRWGHTVSRDVVKSDLAWLAEQALVSVQLVGDGDPYHVATITDRGCDVATGAATVPGVKHPRRRA
ncbi:hypothetical protein [Rhodospirillum centenum]|uniref:E or D n=1 Tax=Rhodospirillum centenum (strain ATCC 51521 / SW) TaxID=414684 RepID=B6IME7_RHOCS|nr:hypothetical protein [Rhodospirillum centenum]ACI98526.1 E or D [Rhodospirillum centenum SW]